MLATTGVRPSELMRAEPADVVLDADPPYWLTRDGKGGRRASGVPLNDEMVTAWRVFHVAQAWGRYETSAFARTLRHAGWPADVPPYRLRASVGIALSSQGVDLADVAGWLGHRDLVTTRTSYVPVLAPRMREATARLAGRVVWPDDAPDDTADTTTAPRGAAGSPGDAPAPGLARRTARKPAAPSTVH